MKKYILIFLMSITTSVFKNLNAQPPFKIVQVKPPQHIQEAYLNWINTNEFWLPHAESGQWVASGVFWKVSGDGAKEYNSVFNLTGYYIVPVNMPSFQPYISAIIISNDGSVDFLYLFGYTTWYLYVKTAQ